MKGGTMNADDGNTAQVDMEQSDVVLEEPQQPVEAQAGEVAQGAPEPDAEHRAEAAVVGVRFKNANRVYYFDPCGFELDVDDKVVVEPVHGPEVATVVIAPRQVLLNELAEPLKPVLRMAEAADFEQVEKWRAKVPEALRKCEEKVAQLNLPMKLISGEYNLDGSRLTFYFSAEGRVDFRELVRELASVFRTRVELRQIGPRDEAKLMGGLGRCGRPLCCTTYLCNFSSVSIRMAKEQDLPLNPMKISGICGRLLCCLGHESDTYADWKKRMPQAGQQVQTPVGTATVISGNFMKETVLVQLETEAFVEVPLKDVVVGQEQPRCRRHRRRRPR